MNYQLIEPLLPLNDNMSVVERVLTARGIKDINHYLHTTDDDILPPENIQNMREGAQLLIKHIANNDEIFICVDADPDGYTSAALMMNYLNSFAPGYTQSKITFKLHEGKEHGLKDMMDYLNGSNNFKLVFMMDASSNDYEYHKILAEKGIDILIIDHHHADHYSENAITINNQMCDYPTKSLSGVGMVWKFCCYLDSLLKTNYAEDLVDLAMIGIIADVMELKDFETKEIVSKGINHIVNPLIKEMFEKQSFSLDKKGRSPFAISFYITPLLNAVIRMGSMEEKTLLFESLLNFKAYDEIPSTKRGCKGQFEHKYQQTYRNCTNLKKKQTEARDSSLTTIQNLIEENHLLDNKILLIQLDEKNKINKNITGLLANKIMSDYQHPVLLLLKTEDENGNILWAGSGRSLSTPDFEDFRSFTEQSGFSQLSQGHAQAFGFAIYDSNINNFINYSNNALKDCNFEPCEKVDFIWFADNINQKEIFDLASLQSIYAQGIPEVKVVIKDVKITQDNTKLMAKNTLRINISNNLSIIGFSFDPEEYEKLLPQSEYEERKINIIGTCSLNHFNGNTTCQILMENYEIEKSAFKYYF